MSYEARNVLCSFCRNPMLDHPRMAGHEITVDLTAGGGKVIVDGVDLSSVVGGLSIVAVAGEFPRMSIDVAPGADVHLIADKAHVDVGQETAEWLHNLDGHELETAVLEAMDLGSGSTMTVVLEVLERWARGGDAVAPTDDEFPSL